MIIRADDYRGTNGKINTAKLAAEIFRHAPASDGAKAIAWVARQLVAIGCPAALAEKRANDAFWARVAASNSYPCS